MLGGGIFFKVEYHQWMILQYISPKFDMELKNIGWKTIFLCEAV